jgi:hypothetical protein
MIADIALGIEPPFDVAFRNGWPPEDYEALAVQEWWQRIVEATRAEQRATGWFQKHWFASMATDMMNQAQAAASRSMDSSRILDVAKYAAKLADMEPKVSTPQIQQGTGFSININLSGSQNRIAESNVLDVPKSNAHKFVAPAIFDPADLPAPPSYLSSLVFEPLTEVA